MTLAPPASAEALLADLETKTHVERMRHMVAIGRLAAEQQPDAVRVIAELRQSGDTYARFLALQSAFGSRDGEAVLLALRDPSRTVRKVALRLVPHACTDEQGARAIALVGTRGPLPLLLQRLRRKRKLDAIDGGMEQLLAASPAQGSPGGRLADVIPFASKRVVREQLHWLHDAGGSVGWSRMGTWHPVLAGDALGSRLPSSGSMDPRLRWQMAYAIDRMARHAPEAALKLTAAILDRGDAPSSSFLAGAWRVLLTQRPTEAFDLLRACHENAQPASPADGLSFIRFTPSAHRLGAERLSYVIEHAWSSLADGLRARRWFFRLNPEERRTIRRAWLERGRGAWGAFLLRYTDAEGAETELRERAFIRWSHAARDGHGVIELARLEVLPADLRIREARRHLNDVPDLKTKARQRMAYARLLPFADAKAALRPWLGHPDGEERAAAISSLVASVRHEPSAMPLALELLHARRYEQDPVRCAMIGALALLPVSAFRPEHLEMVGAVLQDALDAADLSHATAVAVQTLVARLFRVDATWGGRWLTELLTARGSVSAMGLRDLTDAQVEAMIEPLRELCAAWATRERAGAIIQLAWSFGPRLRAIEPLLDALVRLARELPFVNAAAGALGLLRKHAPKRFAPLCAELVERDPSFVALPMVAHFIGYHRQDLLDRFLSNTRIKGRFASGRTHWVIDFGRTSGRWTSRQQARHAEALSGLANVAKQDIPTIRFALKSLAKLAYAPEGLLLAFASDTRPPVREMAVRALPWLDGGQGVPELLECLDDDRARWAIYALRKALSEMPEERVLGILRDAPTAKVTVAKEIMRLLGELGGEEAYRSLLAMDRPGVHRDVRIALLRALWDHLDKPDTWRLFERAAADPDWIVASRLADVPLERLSAASETRMCELLASVLGRPEPEARLDLLGRIPTLPLRDGQRVLFHQCLAHFAAAHPDEGAAACRAALARMLPEEADVIVATIAALSERRAMASALIGQLAAAINPYVAAPIRHVAEGVLEHLSRDPLAVNLYLRLASPLLGYRELAAAFIALSARGGLHADAMALAQSAVRACRHPDLLEQLLAAHESDPNVRRLGLEALRSAASPERGWTDQRRERLFRYRSDPSPMVAEAAIFTFLPEDLR